MKASVRQFVAACHVCQQIKSLNRSPAGLLHPLPIPQHVWEDISMDFITHLPLSQGKTAILVVVDRLTKYGHFCGLPSHYTALQVAAVFVFDIVKLHGFPRTIVSDRDPLFLSSFWTELFRLHGTTLAMSSAYHPQTDGQTEVLNRYLEMYLRSFVCDEPHHWMKFLPWAEYWYNTSHHSAIGMTPFLALYGRVPPELVQFPTDSSHNDAVSQELGHRDTLLQQLRHNLRRAQDRMKLQSDKHRTDLQFSVNDWVFVKLQPYRQKSLALRLNQKLGRRYFGPFRIIARIGTVAYRLELPANSKLHPVFHVSVLKKCIGQPQSQITPLPLLDLTGDNLLTPLAIIQRRHVLRGGSSVSQLLVQWKGLAPADSTWEDEASLRSQFPHFNLEDKVLSAGDCNVTTSGQGNSTPGRGRRERRFPTRLKDYAT